MDEPQFNFRVMTSRALDGMIPLDRQPLTVADLEAVRARCDKATPGTWVAVRERPDWPFLSSPICAMNADHNVLIGLSCDGSPANDRLKDAQFIAHARTDVPRLLHNLDQLRTEIALLRYLTADCQRAARSRTDA
jgi:hypothetical protein